MGNALLALSLFSALWFAFLLLDAQQPLAEQWHLYINPFNNIFLYVAGIAVFYNLKDVQIRPLVLGALFCVSLSILAFYPATGNQIEIVTGVNRVIFLFASIMLVCSFYKFSGYSLIPIGVQYPLEQFGIATYGVYLLHPIVSHYTDHALNIIGLRDPIALFVVVSVLTIVFAIASFNILEKKIIRFGKKLTGTSKNPDSDRS